MSDATINDLMVILARLESKQDAMNEKLDKLEAVNETHADVLRKHEVAIRLLEQRQGPQVHWMTYAVGVVAVIGCIAAFVQYVVK